MLITSAPPIARRTHSPTLAELPPPPPGRTGWPWTVESPRLPDVTPDGRPWPRISIVTPSYNQGIFIEETIRSVLLQGYPNLEYIIIDGASTDNSPEIIQRYSPWLTYWVSERDRGQTDAINKGFQKSTGAFLNWLNSDDLLSACSLSSLAEIVLETGADVVCGTRKLITREGRHYYTLNTWVEAWPLYWLGLPDFPQESTFFSAKLWSECGPLDVELEYNFDVFFFSLASQAASKIALTHYPLGAMRIYPEIKTLQSDPLKLEEIRWIEQAIKPRKSAERLFHQLARTRLRSIAIRYGAWCSRKNGYIDLIDWDAGQGRWKKRGMPRVLVSL